MQRKNPGIVKIYHVISNFRWTERAEPAADLACGQQACGADAGLICGRNRLAEEDSVAFQARRKGLDPIVLELPKHFRLKAAWKDIRAIRALVREQQVDVLHSHLPNAQLTNVLACGRVRNTPLIVHSVYEPDGKAMPLRNRIFSFAGTHGWVVVAAEARNCLTQRYGIAPERILLLEPPVDIERFQTTTRNVRATFGLAPDDVVVGLVSRIGTNRGVDLLLKAIALIKAECPRLKALIVGRGEIEGAVKQPAAELGISDRIVLAGYCRGEKLVAAYRAMDIFSYMQPGTDKSCRAIREALAAGVPVTGKRTGFIPTLIREDETGRLFENDPADLARVLKEQYLDPDSRTRMARAAAIDAASRFDRHQQGQHTINFYKHLQDSMPLAPNALA